MTSRTNVPLREPSDLRDGRNVRAGRASRAAIDAARSGVHLHRPRHARARHRPQHRDFLRRLRRALASAAVSQSRSPRHHLVSAADRDGRQDVLDLGARDVRGAAPARHHARSSRGLHLDRRAAHRTRRAAAGARARRESEFLRHAGRQSRARPRVPHRRRGARRRSQPRSSAIGCGARRSRPIRRSSDSPSPSTASPVPSSACCRRTSASGR